MATSINSKAAFFILKAGSKYVADGGKIITIVTALLAAFTGFYTSYAGSKAPVEHFTRGVAKELQSRLVSVNAIAPGPMDTRELCLDLQQLQQKQQQVPTAWEAKTDTRSSLLLPARVGRSRGLSQEPGPGWPTDRGQGHCAAGALPRHRGRLDHGPDAVCQRWLHDPIDVCAWMMGLSMKQMYLGPVATRPDG